MAKDTSTIFSSENTDKQQLDYLKIGKDLIFGRINSLRSEFQFSTNKNASVPNQLPPMKESYCHTFYRILGLPVISADKVSFYNPGFYGSEVGDINIEKRNAIDNSQDIVLFNIEREREFLCYGTDFYFQSESTKQQYRYDLLKQPIAVFLLNENAGAFQPDIQQDSVDNRTRYKPTKKLLRPFKCVPSLTNNVIPVTNQLCAPFVSDANSKIRNVKLTKPYLEFVARMRLSKDIRTNTVENKLSEALQKKIESFDSLGNVLSAFSTSIKDLSLLELYVIERLLLSIFEVCNKINKEKKSGQELISKMGAKFEFTNSGVTFDALERDIRDREEKIAAKEFVLSQIPVANLTGIGNTENSIDCLLTTAFVELVQADLKNLEKELDEFNNEKKKRLNSFNSLNSELFYTLGEVNGIGLIDAIAMMLSFWLITPEELVSMFDQESFDRLLTEPSLYSDVVQARLDQESPLVPIGNVMESFDKNVVLILKLADAIVETNKT